MSKLEEILTADVLAEEAEGAQYLRDRHLEVSGATKLLKFEVQKADLRSGAVSAYVCLDFSQNRVLNQAGDDLTPSSRKDKQTSFVRFVWSNNVMKIRENGAWPGESIC